jgi:energy-coupling factor transporter ATP-binding protein EcfA2
VEKIILISGKSGNGKSTVAGLFKELLKKKDKKVLILPFAKYLKQYLKEYYGWDGITKDIVYRNNAQKLGEIIRKKLGASFFAKRICEDIEIVGDRDLFDYVIIDDCRYLNELSYTISQFPHKTISVRINRIDFKSKLTEEQLEHPSETDLDDYEYFDYTIWAKKGLDRLMGEAERVLNQMLKEG